jgi:phosphate transport system substrate-binding protein
MRKTLAGFVGMVGAAVAVSAALAENVEVRTADVLAPLTVKWADAYGKQHSELTITSTAGSTPASIQAFAESHPDLVIVPRAIKFKEAQATEAALGKRPADFKFAVNGAAVYLNAANPVKVLTYAELAGVFTGKYSNWKDLGGNDAPIKLYGCPADTAAGELFKEEVLEGKALPAAAQILSGSELLSDVAKDPNAISFGPLAQADGVRALAIKRAPSSTPATPSEETISRRTYPISRYVFGYINPASDKPALKAYVDWIRGEEGQQVVRSAGFYPLPPALRGGQ